MEKLQGRFYVDLLDTPSGRSLGIWPSARAGIDLGGHCPNHCLPCSGNQGLRYGLELRPFDNLAQLTRLISTAETEISEVVITGLPGEPLTSPRLLDVVRVTGRVLHSQERYRPIRVNTSGLTVSEPRELLEEMKSAGVEKIAISLNALKPSDYENFCRPSIPDAFDRVVTFIQEAIAVFGPDNTYVSFLDLTEEHVPIHLRPFAVQPEKAKEFLIPLGVKPDNIIFRTYLPPDSYKYFGLGGVRIEDEERNHSLDQLVRKFLTRAIIPKYAESYVRVNFKGKKYDIKITQKMPLKTDLFTRTELEIVDEKGKKIVMSNYSPNPEDNPEHRWIIDKKQCDYQIDEAIIQTEDILAEGEILLRTTAIDWEFPYDALLHRELPPLTFLAADRLRRIKNISISIWNSCKEYFYEFRHQVNCYDLVRSRIQREFSSQPLGNTIVDLYQAKLQAESQLDELRKCCLAKTENEIRQELHIITSNYRQAVIRYRQVVSKEVEIVAAQSATRILANSKILRPTLDHHVSYLAEILGSDQYREILNYLEKRGWTGPMAVFPRQDLNCLPDIVKRVAELALLWNTQQVLASYDAYTVLSPPLPLLIETGGGGTGFRSSRRFLEGRQRDGCGSGQQPLVEASIQPCIRMEDLQKPVEGGNWHSAFFHMLTLDISNPDKIDHRKAKLDALETWFKFAKDLGLYPAKKAKMKAIVCAGGNALSCQLPADDIAMQFFEELGIAVEQKPPQIRETLYAGLEPFAGLQTELYVQSPSNPDEWIEIGLFIDLNYDLTDDQGNLVTPERTADFDNLAFAGNTRLCRHDRNWYSAAWGAERLAAVMGKLPAIHELPETAAIEAVVNIGLTEITPRSIPREAIAKIIDLSRIAVFVTASEISPQQKFPRIFERRVLKPLVEEIIQMVIRYSSPDYPSPIEFHRREFFNLLFTTVIECYQHHFPQLKDNREQILNLLVDYCMDHYMPVYYQG